MRSQRPATAQVVPDSPPHAEASMDDISPEVVPATLDPQIKLGGTTQATAKNAAEFLLSLNKGFCVPNKTQRRNMLVAYAELGFVLYGKAFDLVRCDIGVNYDDLDDIRRNLTKLLVYEIKSTNKKNSQTRFL